MGVGDHLPRRAGCRNISVPEYPEFDLTRVDAQINYLVDADYPTGFATDFVSRHTGLLTVATAGSYTLYLNSDDGSRLYLDGALAINDDGSHGMTEKSATLTLAAGAHALRVEYFQGGGGKGLVMSWAGPAITKAVVPASALSFASVANSAPVAQAQTLAAGLNTALAITLGATDGDGDPLTYSIVTQPAHGTLSGTAPHLLYHPAMDFLGNDPFTFKANDGRADSNTATVTIAVSGALVAPSVVDQPKSLSVAVGQTATFTVTATGTAPLTYQWRKNGTAIAGATSASYTTPATTASDNGAKYSVVVSGVGTATSLDATLLVIKSLDLNGDAVVDVLDLAALASAYGTTKAGADLDSSGTVDDADITLWLAGF